MANQSTFASLPSLHERLFPETSESQRALHKNCDHEEQPPPYSATAGKPSRPTARPWEVERLRRFISYNLAVEYGLGQQTIDRLHKEDWHFWVQLSNTAFTLYEKENPKAWFPFLDWSVALTNEEMTDGFIEPAAELGIPPRHILFRLLTFASSILRGKGAASAMTFKTDYGLHILAAKLAFDRDELFDKVLPENHNFRALMFGKHQEVRDKFFLDLNTQAGLAAYNHIWHETARSRAESKFPPPGETELRLKAEEKRYAHYLAEFSDIDIVPADPRDAKLVYYLAVGRMKGVRRSISWAVRRAARFSSPVPEYETQDLGWWARKKWRGFHASQKSYYIRDKAHWESYRREISTMRVTFEQVAKYMKGMGLEVDEILREGRTYLVWSKEELREA